MSNREYHTREGTSQAASKFPKSLDFLEDIGRPIAFYPSLIPILGNIKRTLFVCQLAYWTPRSLSPDGWVYKSKKQWTEETGLTEDEQRTICEALVEMKVIKKDYDRLNHRMNYWLNKEVLEDLWNHAPSGIFPDGETGNYQMGNGDNPSSRNGGIPTRYKGTETTAESTHKDYEQRGLPNEEEGVLGVRGARQVRDNPSNGARRENFPKIQKQSLTEDEGPPLGALSDDLLDDPYNFDEEGN